MKCEQCGLEYKITTSTNEYGDVRRTGGHNAGGKDCLTRQLAAKSTECEKLREACEGAHAYLVKLAPKIMARGGDETDLLMKRLRAALFRAERKEDGR